MLAGYPPFYDENPYGIYQKILKGSIEWPKWVAPAAQRARAHTGALTVSSSSSSALGVLQELQRER